MGGNQKTRVDFPIDLVQGTVVGANLLQSLKDDLILENVFRLMFGSNGERIFINDLPSLNETILPCLMVRWKQETFRSNNTYLDGSIGFELVLPVKLKGDFNALRRAATIFQRWLSGAANLYPQNKGLIMFGFESNWNYEGLAKFDGITAPAIVANIPFRFDLALLREEFDPTQPLDESDIGFIESITLTVFDEETETEFLSEVVQGG